MLEKPALDRRACDRADEDERRASPPMLQHRSAHEPVELHATMRLFWCRNLRRQQQQPTDHQRPFWRNLDLRSCNCFPTVGRVPLRVRRSHLPVPSRNIQFSELCRLVESWLRMRWMLPRRSVFRIAAVALAAVALAAVALAAVALAGAPEPSDAGTANTHPLTWAQAATATLAATAFTAATAVTAAATAVTAAAATAGPSSAASNWVQISHWHSVRTRLFERCAPALVRL